MWFLSVIASVTLFDLPGSGVSTVRANLDRMEFSAARNTSIRSELDLLPPSYAPALLSQLPTVKHAAVMQMAARWFVKNHYPAAIPSLIQSFDKRFLSNSVTRYPPAASAIANFEGDAVPYLLQACRQGSPYQVSICAGMHGVEVFRPDLLRYVIDAACASDRETAAFAKGYLYRLVWEADMKLAPKDWAAGPPPSNLSPAMFDQVLASKVPHVRAAAVVLESRNDGLDQNRLKALSDPDPLVFHAAVVSSRVIIGVGWLPHLVKLAASTDPRQRRGAALLLAASFDPAKPTHRQLAKDPDPDIRSAARFDW